MIIPPYEINDTQKEYFKYYGYIQLNNILNVKLLDHIIEETNEIKRQQITSLDSWKYTPVKSILNLSNHPIILNILSQLYGYTPFPFQTLNFKDSPAIGLHADTIHFDSTPYGYMCGVWVALENTTEDNGPLEYFPSSHHLTPTYFQRIEQFNYTQHLTNTEALPYHHQTHGNYLQFNAKPAKFAQNISAYTQYLTDKIHKLKIQHQTLLCEKGTIFIWDANLLHRSRQPRPHLTRYSQVTHYYFDVPNSQYLVPAHGKIKEEVYRYKDHIAGQ